jgi:hypothetical protein
MPRLCNTKVILNVNNILLITYSIKIMHCCCTLSIVNGNLPPINTTFSFIIKVEITYSVNSEFCDG